jgi:hypothetical protein
MISRTGGLAAAFIFALGLTAAAFVVPARAATVFADFTPDAASPDFRWVQSAALTGGHLFTVNAAADATAQAVDAHFSFLDAVHGALVFLPVDFMLDATVADGTPAASLGPLVSQGGVDGTFSFIYGGPSTVIDGFSLVSGVTNLLSGSFVGGRITGLGHSGSVNLTTLGGALTYASDLGTFSGQDEFAFNLLDAVPGFGATAGHSLSPFVANGGGNFSAGVPEPASWALLILGFGGIGATLRSRRSAALAA